MRYGEKVGYALWILAVAVFCLGGALADADGWRLAAVVSVGLLVGGAICFFASRLERLQATEELRTIRKIVHESGPPPVSHSNR